jgi:hypothetical protein
MNNHGSFFISSAYGSFKQLNIFIKVAPEKFRQSLDRHMGFHKLSDVSNSLIITTASPEKGGVHESSKNTDGRRRETSLWSGNCCAVVGIAKIMTGLSGVIAIECRDVISRLSGDLVSCERLTS